MSNMQLKMDQKHYVNIWQQGQKPFQQCISHSRFDVFGNVGVLLSKMMNQMMG